MISLSPVIFTEVLHLCCSCFTDAPSDLLGKVRREPQTEDGKSDTDGEINDGSGI